MTSVISEISYDVAVLGGGPSGVCAAIAAAKGGAKTILVEKSAVLGGMSAGGLVTLWCGKSEHGFFKQTKADMNEMRGRRNVFDPERIKVYFLQKVQEAGVDILLHTSFLEAEKKDDHISSVLLFSKNGKTRLKAQVFIDCTGDGDVAVSAGADFQFGRTADSLAEPVTLMFMVGNVDTEQAVYPTFGTHPNLEAKMAEYVAAGKIDAPAGHVILIEGFQPNTACVNMTNLIRVNGTDPFELTRAEIFTRKQIPQIVQFLRDCVPGYQNCYLTQTAEYVGVRESRHIFCDYLFNEDDIIAGKVFEDWIASGLVHGFGAHNLTGSGADKSNREKNLNYDGRPYTIPYRSLLVKGLDNLLVAGRAIGGNHLAHSNYRVMPICMATGDGAGSAAALAVKHQLPLRKIDIDELHQFMEAVLGVPNPAEASSEK